MSILKIKLIIGKNTAKPTAVPKSYAGLPGDAAKQIPGAPQRQDGKSDKPKSDGKTAESGGAGIKKMAQIDKKENKKNYYKKTVGNEDKIEGEGEGHNGDIIARNKEIKKYIKFFHCIVTLLHCYTVTLLNCPDFASAKSRILDFAP